MVRQTINLHLVPDAVKPTVYLEQYDNNLVQLVFNLVGISDYYTIPGGTYVSLVGRKPDGKAFSYACTWNGYTVTVNVTDQITAVPGKIKAQLRFTNAAGDALLSSIGIDIIVNRSPLDGLRCSKNDFISVEKTLNGARSDAIAAQNYAIDAQNAYNDTVTAKNDAISAIQSQENTSKSAVQAVATNATSDINSAASSVNGTFNRLLDEIQLNTEHPNYMYFEYIEEADSQVPANSFRISTLVPNQGG